MVRFEEINYLAWLLAALVVLFYISRIIRQQTSLSKLWEGNQFLSKLLLSIKLSHWPWRIPIFGLGLMAGIIGLSNPQYGYHNEEIVKSSNDIFVALDISNSMKAEDIAPDRLSKAKQYCANLITKLKGNNIGLIFFAGEAYMQMPLTSDYAAAVMMVNTADPEMAGLQGTDINSVADLIVRANSKQATPSNYLILITDGEDHEQQGLDGITKLSSTDMKTFVVAAGTETGGMMKMQNDYKRDPASGEPIISKINLGYINNLAKAGKGKAFSIEDEGSINKIVAEISNTAKSNTTMKSINEYNSYFQLFAILALMAFIIEYFLSKKKYLTKGSLLKTSALLLFFMPLHTDGQNSKDLQEGVSSYQKQKYKEAEDKFKKAKKLDKTGKANYNLGNTLYKQGKYEEASKVYEESSATTPSQKLKAQSQYNRGNANVQQQKYSDAVQDYKSSLNTNKSDQLALNNLMKAKRDMKKQQEQQKNKDQQNQNNQNNQDQPPQNNNKDKKESKDNKENSDKDKKDQDKDQNGKQPPTPSTPSDLNQNQAFQMIEREEEKVQKKLKRNPNKSKAPLKDW